VASPDATGAVPWSRGDGACRLSPRNVQVVSFVYDFFRATASRSNSACEGVSVTTDDRLTASREVESAACDVERALDPTHSAIALRRAPTGGRT
jgi:hypothetical protein